jgi:CRP/FNR family cyclic AMP-dependent transcriptional regulator
MVTVAFLKGLDVFNGLSDRQLRKVVALCRELEFKEGETILFEGAHSDEMYMITQGEVEILVDSAPPPECPTGEGKLSITHLGAGQVFGEMALVDRGLRSATVRCVTDDTRLLAIQRENFMALCEEDTRLGFVVMRNLAADLSFKLRSRNLAWR